MYVMFWRSVIGLFLVLHGIVSAFVEPESWLFDGGRGVFLTLGVVAAGLLTVGAIVIAGDGAAWRLWVGSGAAVSLAQLLLFFEPRLFGGVAIDVAILAAVAWMHRRDSRRAPGEARAA